MVEVMSALHMGAWKAAVVLSVLIFFRVLRISVSLFHRPAPNTLKVAAMLREIVNAQNAQITFMQSYLEGQGQNLVAAECENDEDDGNDVPGYAIGIMAVLGALCLVFLATLLAKAKASRDEKAAGTAQTKGGCVGCGQFLSRGGSAPHSERLNVTRCLCYCGTSQGLGASEVSASESTAVTAVIHVFLKCAYRRTR